MLLSLFVDICKIKAPTASKQKMNKQIVPIIPPTFASFLKIFLTNGTIRLIDVEIIMIYVPPQERTPTMTAGTPSKNAPGIGVIERIVIPNTNANQTAKLTKKNGIIKIFVTKEPLVSIFSGLFIDTTSEIMPVTNAYATITINDTKNPITTKSLKLSENVPLLLMNNKTPNVAEINDRITNNAFLNFIFLSPILCTHKAYNHYKNDVNKNVNKF